MYLLAPFIRQNFKKILRANLELWRCTIFGPKMGHLSWTKFFWYKLLLLLSSTNWAFQCAKFNKNSYSGSRVMRIRNFWAQNDPFLQIRIFFRKPVKEPCFFHSCLSKCQKSKSDINLLVKYWQLKNTEISLAESHFWL